MNPNELLQDFFNASADAVAMDGYLAGLARSDARTVLGQVQEDIDALRAELAGLVREREALRDEMKRLRLALSEHLLAFLPVIYRDFWTVVSPGEFALMSGRIEAPRIPSPWVEPGPDTMRFMRQRFAALEQGEREQLLAFCRALPHRLQIRAEMRAEMRALLDAPQPAAEGGHE